MSKYISNHETTVRQTYCILFLSQESYNHIL